MTFTLFSSNLVWALRDAILHVAHAPADSCWTRMQNLMLTVVAVVFYHLGRREGSMPRREHTSEKSLSIDPRITSTRENLESLRAGCRNVVVLPALVTTLGELAKLVTAVGSIVRAGGVVVLVDDGSPINVNSVVRDRPFVVLVKHAENYGPGAARNTGLEVALEVFSPSFIAFTDADCVVDSGWLYEHARHQREEPGVWSGQTAALRPGYIARYHDAMGTLNGRRNATGGLIYGPTCNLSVASTILRTARFDERFPSAAFEDVEFCVRLIKSDIVPRYARSALVRHDYALTLSDFARQFHRYGTGHSLMEFIHPDFNNWYAFSSNIPVDRGHQR